MVDLFAPDLEERLRVLLSRIQVELTSLNGETLPSPAVYADLCREWAEHLKPSLRDTEQLLNGWIKEGKSLLFEGAQGSLLDIDHGTYPYVTSSSSTTGGACTGTGVPPTKIDGAIGILKAYTTRVGGGPFPSELTDATGEFLRSRGNEFGTVTGRPRRCGWLDTVAARYGQLLNGVSTVALTKLDVLDDFDEIPVCTAYKLHGETVRDFPPDRRSLESRRAHSPHLQGLEAPHRGPSRMGGPPPGGPRLHRLHRAGDRGPRHPRLHRPPPRRDHPPPAFRPGPAHLGPACPGARAALRACELIG